jgi:hypothetical protein
VSLVRGLALPSWLVAVCAALVAFALVGFMVTGERDADVSATPPTGDGSAAVPTDRPAARPDDPGKDESEPPDRVVVRRTADVEVYNNAGITGLADQTSGELQGAGWDVVTTDNWYGQIPASTVYYPAGLEPQARLLARDLGVRRLHPAISPMSFDRLTVILTGAP